VPGTRATVGGTLATAMKHDSPQDCGLTIPYADVPARLGIVYETRPGGLRMTIPRSPGIVRDLWLTAAAEIVVLGLVGLLSGANLCAIGVFAALLGLVLLYRVFVANFGPAVIEVFDEAVILRNVETRTESRADTRDFVRPRAAVYEVKYVSHSGNLVVKARGHEMIECRPVRRPEALEWIAARIREALGLKC
jgi:hypothetical protein